MNRRTVAMDVTRYSSGHVSTAQETVPIETPVRLILNGRPVTDLACTPTDMECLGVGHLVSRGLLTNREQLVSVETAAGPDLAEIRISTRQEPEPTQIPAPPPTPGEKQRVPAEDLLASVRFLQEGSAFFRETGSAHRSVVFRADQLLADYEDIARHNTLDKVLGRFFCDQLHTEGTVLCTTGRLFYEIVSKGAAGGFPVIASRGAATDRAVELATRAGITLVGFVRGDRFNIYSHSQRIRV